MPAPCFASTCSTARADLRFSIVSIRQHTSASVSIRQHTSASVSIGQHRSASVSIGQHRSASVSILNLKHSTHRIFAKIPRCLASSAAASSAAAAAAGAGNCSTSPIGLWGLVTEG
jgi:hypothetical protein